MASADNLPFDDKSLQNLRRDLETGEWERRNAELLTLDEYDAGYRLVVAD